MAFDDTGGAGVPLVFVHGFPLDRTYWSSQVRELAAAARVIAPDLRGFGESGLSSLAMERQGATGVTIETYADDVRGLLDALGIKSAIIAGLSMGGYIAFEFYRKFSHRVRALILADTRAAPDSPEAKQTRNDHIALVREQGAGALAERLLPKLLMPQTLATNVELTNATREMLARQPVEGIVAALGALRDRSDATPMLADIAVPTLILVGADDTLIPPRESEALRGAIRNSQLVMIPNAAHLSNLEQPDAFNRAVREFLKTV
ncbi:MAG: alpha/beta fold hydrolase [Chloroflexi bacterium]|nr:alpha/beta fold hydrolase [Chloroflexota bacterium]